MFKKLCIFLIATSVLTGFTSHSDQLKARLEQMPQHYTQFDVKMGWMVSGGNSGTTINGIIKNVRYAMMDDIEIWVALVDAKGNQLARSVDYIIPNRLDRDDVAPFAITLPTTAPAHSKLIFTYKYLGDDGSDNDGGATRWMQSFESQL